MSTVVLASLGLDAVPRYLSAHPSELNLLFVPTAADLDAETPWLDRDRKTLTKMGFGISELDIKRVDFDQSMKVLEYVDVLYVAGGNTFYLLHMMNETGFGEAIKKTPSLMYVGASAGAAVAGVDIGPLRTLDRPELIDGLDSTAGLGLVPFVVMPHYSAATNGAHYDDIMKNYRDYEYVVLNDKQACISVDGTVEIVGSR